MKVKELLRDGVPFVELKPLQAKNLRCLCKLGLQVSLIRRYAGDIPYCSVCSPHQGIDNVYNHICIFPIRNSMDICTVVNRVIAIVDYMGYIKHVKNEHKEF